jgi:hypothetical protein
MPHPDQENVIRLLQNENLQLADEFRKCIEYARNWRQRSQLQAISGDAFSNVMNKCNANLAVNLLHNPMLLNRAQACLNYYKNNRI